MPFKIRENDIVSGLSLELGNKKLPSTENILNIELDKQEKRAKEQKEKENINSLVDIFSPTKDKTTAKPPKKGKDNEIVKKDLLDKTKKDNIKTEIDIFVKNKNQRQLEIINDLKSRENTILQATTSTKSIAKTNLVSGKSFLSIGKNLHIFSENVFGQNFKDFVAKDFFSNENSLNDSLRSISGRFWSIDNTNRSSVRFVSTDLIDNKNIPISFNFHSIENDTDDSDFGRINQFVSIEVDENRFVNANKQYSRTLFEAFTLGREYIGSTPFIDDFSRKFNGLIREDVVFHDYSFILSLPFNEKELKKYGDFKGSLISNIKADYNFFIEDYELGISSKDVLENTLPNMYVLLLENESEKSNPILSKLITLGDSIKTDQKKLLGSNKKDHKNSKKSRTYSLKDNPLGEYYDLFGRQYKNAKKEIIQELNKKFSNIIFSIKDLEVLKKSSNRQEMFPLSVDITFSTDRSTQICRMLKDSSLFDIFVTEVVNKISQKNIKNIKTHQVFEQILDSEGFNNASKSIITEQRQLNVLEVDELLADLKQNNQQLDKTRFTYLGDYEKIQQIDNKSEFKFFRSLSAEIFQAKLQSFLKSNIRTFKDILDGQLCYNETILYRIAKFIGDPTR